MKKIFLLIAVAVGITAPAHAQLEITEAPVDSTETYTLASMWNWLHLRGDSWHIVMKTDNPTDEYIWMKMGDNLEDAIISVLQLEDALKNMADGVCFRVEDMDRCPVYITNYQPLIKKQGFIVHGEHRFGTAYLNTGSITRAKVILLTERNRRYQNLKAREKMSMEK